MNGTIVLAGSGEFGQSMDELDSHLVKKLGNPKIAIIPTAAGREPDWATWIDRGLEHFGHIGGKPEGVELIDRDHTENPAIVQKLTSFDFFYFSGGDPGYLLDTIKNTPSWDVIYQRFQEGATLAGSSAGAMVLGKKLWARIYDFVNHQKIKPWEEGLGVVDFGVIPHFNLINKDLNPLQKGVFKRLLPRDVKILGIDELTAYVLEDGQWQKWGSGDVRWVN
jgi:cyanophycinase